MLEKVNGKSGAATNGGGAKSLSSPPFVPKGAAKNLAAAKGMKRKSRSPSPAAVEPEIVTAPAFGPTETLQRERLKRLRKEKMERAQEGENGGIAGKVNGLKGAERCSARKSINPRRLSVSKVELAVMVERTKRKDVGDGKAASGGFDKIPQKQVNGTMAKLQDSACTAKKVKIDFEMEESDEEDENEGLKMVMENIDSDLNVPAQKKNATAVEEEEKEQGVGEKMKVSISGCVQAEVERLRNRSTERKAEEAMSRNAQSAGTEGSGKDSWQAAKRMKEEEKGDADAEVLCIVDSPEGDKNDKTKDTVGKWTKNCEKVKALGPSLADETITLEGSRELAKEKETTNRSRVEEREKGEDGSGKRDLEENEQACSRRESKRTKGKEAKENKKERANETMLLEDECRETDDGTVAKEPQIACRKSDSKEKKAEAEEVEGYKVENLNEKAEEDKPMEKKESSSVKVLRSSNAEGHSGVDETRNCLGKVKKEEEEKEKTNKRTLGENSDATVGTEAKAEEKPRSKEEEEDDEVAKAEESSKDKVYRLTKSELEMLVINKVTEFFSDSNKSELGALRHRCEQLEKYLEQWRRKAQFYQKQMTDMQSLVQRARRFAMPQRPSMRSVGLQVQLTRYIPADPSKLVSRVAQLGVPVSKPHVIAGAPAGQQQIILPKQVSASQLAFVTNLGPQGMLAGATLFNKNGMPQLSNVGMTATVNTMLTCRPQTSSFSVPTKVGGSMGQLHGGQLGVSLLQPRVPATPGSYIIGSTQSAAGSSIVKAPGSGPLLRTTLDGTKATSTTGTPVPTCLVQNQALSSGQPTSSAASQTTATRPLSVSLIGQPTVVTSAVKLIDLTADEEEAKAQQQTAMTAASSAASAAVPAAAMMPATLCASNNTMTVLTPTSVPGGSTGQLLALSSAIVSSAGSLGSATPIRVTAPIRGPGSTIVNNGAVRLTYLRVPTSSMMTMVRPNQPVFVTPSTGIRPGPPGVPRQGLPTIVLQRGTTLVPLQQGQMTTLPAVRPGAIISSATRTISTPTGPITLVGAPSVNRPITTLAASLPPASGVTSYSLTSGVANAMLNVPVAKTVTTPTHVLKHPAPLPIQPKYPELPPTSGKKAIPPKPALKISKVSNGIVLSWNMSLAPSHSDIASYQLYAYQEGASPPSTALWKKVGDVKALPLPMACTLTQFMEGHKYYFAVRAVDTFNRLGPFSDPGSIALAPTAPAAPIGRPTPVALKS